MTFAQAKKKLKEMAKGDFYNLEFKFLDFQHSDGTGKETECTVYVDGFHHNSADTWEHALAKLEEEMHPCFETGSPKGEIV